MKNATSWFSIAATDFDRAKKFYEELYDQELNVMESDGDKMLMLPGDMENGGVGGAITQGPGREPSDKGTIVYLNFEGDLQEVIDRVDPAGGKVTVQKTPIEPDMGYYAQIIDTEGSIVGLWSEK